MSKPIRHIVFTPSGAGTLRQALQTAGRNDDVVSLFDDLSFGPIDTLDPRARAKWVADELGWDDREEVSGRAFWLEALSPDHRKVVWMSRRSAMEFTGFLEWLSRLGTAKCEIVDMTEEKISRHVEYGPAWPSSFAVSLASLLPDEIRDGGFLDRDRELTQIERDHYQALWTKLRAENAPLRVIEEGALVSAPISFFDAQLMSFVTSDWQKVARIIGEALVAQMDGHVFQAGDFFLAGRINRLVEHGAIECRGGTPLDLQRSEIRLSSPKHA